MRIALRLKLFILVAIAIGSLLVVTMASSIYVGLPLTSHRDGTVATATLDNVSVSP